MLDLPLREGELALWPGTWWRATSYESVPHGEDFMIQPAPGAELVTYDPALEADGVPGGELLLAVATLGEMPVTGQASLEAALDFANRFGLFGAFFRAAATSAPLGDRGAISEAFWKSRELLDYGESLSLMVWQAAELRHAFQLWLEFSAHGDPTRVKTEAFQSGRLDLPAVTWGEAIQKEVSAFPIRLQLRLVGRKMRMGYQAPSLSGFVRVLFLENVLRTEHRFARCERANCQKFFFARRFKPNTRFCSARCQNAENQQRWRKRKKEGCS